LGVKERQEREREAVSRAILDAARDLFVAEGYHNVSIRKIAERIEYSPAAIYSYFPSKDDIFFALAEEGFHSLFAKPHPQSAEPADDLDAIRRAFWRVYEFSKSHPEYFALMFVDRSVPRINKDWQRFGFVREMKVQLGARIQRAIDAGHFPAGSQADTIFRILLASIHGVAVWGLSNRVVPGEDADALARDTLEATLTGLRAGSPTTFVPVHCAESPSEVPE
jgi:AcrR family transcriptional regulator